MSLYDQPFVSQPKDLRFEVERVSGTLPEDLRGTLLRVGPGMLEAGADPVHMFDANALVCALAFAGGQPRLTARHVRTDTSEAERRDGRLAKRGLFTNLPQRLKNIANVKLRNGGSHDVYTWGGKVFATNDPGHYALDPQTLDTLGPDRWAGLAPAGHLMSPMPRPDPATGRLVVYTVQRGGTEKLTFHELDAAFRPVASAATDLSGAGTLVHDLAFTPRFHVVFANPTKLHLPSALWGARPLVESLRWQPGQTPTLYLVPRAGGPARTFAVPGDVRTIFHIANAFEDGEQVVVDVVAYAGTLDAAKFGPPALRARQGEGGPNAPPVLLRLTADLASGRIAARPLGTVAGELPEVAPGRFGQPYRYLYVASPDASGAEPDPHAFPWFHAVAKVDVTTGAHTLWSAGPQRFCSQPVFAARAGGQAEDDGHLLVWVHDPAARTVDVVVLDAQDLARGPLATVHLGEHLPASSHCAFVGEIVG